MLNEQRTDKVNRLKIAERERDALSGSKAEAEAFLEKEKEIRRKKNVLYQIHEKATSIKAQGLKEQVEEAKQVIIWCTLFPSTTSPKHIVLR